MNQVIYNPGIPACFHKNIVVIEQHNYSDNSISFFAWTKEYWDKVEKNNNRVGRVARFIVKPKLTPAP